MTYYLSRIVAMEINAAVSKVKEALAREGFGVLTDIDIQATLKAKLGAEHPAYRILGACNPSLAHAALQLESKLGVLLPCNVLVRQCEPERVEIAAVDPVSSMERTGNAQLTGLALEVRERLKRAVEAV